MPGDGRPEYPVGIPGITDGYETPYGDWELNPGSLHEQYMLSTSGSSLQLPPQEVHSGYWNFIEFLCLITPPHTHSLLETANSKEMKLGCHLLTCNLLEHAPSGAWDGDMFLLLASLFPFAPKFRPMLVPKESVLMILINFAGFTK